jgi:uncharacterized protein (TIGR03437 family)
MDAARTLKHTALLLSAALAFAAPSFAQTLVVSPTTVGLTASSQSQNVTVTSSDGTTVLPFSVSGITPSSPAWFSVSQTAGTAGKTPATLAVTLTRDCTYAACTGSFTVGSQTVTVNYTAGSGGGGGGGGSGPFYASQSSVSLTQGSSTSITLYNNTASAVTFSIGVPTASWLLPSPSTTTIAANSSVLLTIFAGFYSSGLNPASFTVTSGTTTLTITATLTGVGTSGGLIPSPSTVSLSYPGTPGSVAVTVTNGSGNPSTNYYAVATTSSGGQWISLYPGGGTTSSVQVIGTQILVAVNGVASGLGTGTYNGTVTLYDGTTFQPLGSFAVTLSVNGGTGTGGVAAPTALTYAYQAGGVAPYQVILVNGFVSNATFVATGGGWANSSVSLSFNGASNQVFVSVPNGQPAGSYTGTVTVTNASGLSQAISVTLTVYSGATLLVSPGSQGDYTCTYVTGQQTCSANNYAISASDGSSMSISASSSVTWATVTCSSATTPALCTVQVSPSGLPNGLNTGVVTVTTTSTSTNGSVAIPIVVLVTGSSGGNTGYLTLNPTSLTFTTNATASQQVSVTSTQGGSVPFAINWDQNWLSATASNSNVTPSTLTVTVNAAGLNAGQTYTGNVLLQAGSIQQQIPVTLTVGAGGAVQVTSNGTVLNSTTGLTFSGQSGGSAPAAQSITVASTSGATGVAFTYTTSVTWLLVNGVTSGNGTTSTTLPVTVNAAGLTPSNTPYTGTVTITPTGGTAVTFPVSFTVTPASTVSASPTSLSFSYTAGSGNVPTSQTLNVAGNGNFSASASSNGNWCQVIPTSGTAPTTLTVSLMNLDSLAVNQSYTCTITVSGTGTTVGSTTVTVTLTVTAPLPTILKVTNAASFNTGSISAGEIITIFGTAIGPSTGVSASATNGQFPTTLGGVQVLVGGYPAAMIYASATQVSAVVPYEINRPVFLQSVSVQVKYIGQTSNGVQLTQVAAAPGIFTANSSGSGPGAILNSNLSVNSASNPAAAASTVVLYVTGEGQTIPAGVTGKVTSGTAPFTVPVVAPTVTINGVPAVVAFYAEAPTLVSGVLQINVVIPQGVGTGNLPVVVSFGSATSQLTSAGIGAVTLAVQ